MSTDMISAIRTAVSARKDSLSALRSRIWALLDELPVGVRLSDDDGEVCRIVRVETSAHQGPGWPVRINRAAGALADGCLLAAGDLDEWDGSNWQHAFGCPRLRNGADTPYLSGAETRKLAARLPLALARYIDACEAERVANAATLTR